jgi:hypothetical protein
MKKKTEEIEVEVVEDSIHIRQPDPAGNNDGLVIVSPDQVVLLIEWLREARDKIRGTDQNGTDRKRGS